MSSLRQNWQVYNEQTSHHVHVDLQHSISSKMIAQLQKNNTVAKGRDFVSLWQKTQRKWHMLVPGLRCLSPWHSAPQTVIPWWDRRISWHQCQRQKLYTHADRKQKREKMCVPFLLYVLSHVSPSYSMSSPFYCHAVEQVSPNQRLWTSRFPSRALSISWKAFSKLTTQNYWSFVMYTIMTPYSVTTALKTPNES